MALEWGQEDAPDTGSTRRQNPTVGAPQDTQTKTRVESWVKKSHKPVDTGGDGLVTTHAGEVRIRREGVYKSVMTFKKFSFVK